MDKEVLTIEEVAEIFSVSKRTIYNLLKAKELPGVKIGGQWRFLKEDLMKIFATKTDKNKRELNYDRKNTDEDSCC